MRDVNLKEDHDSPVALAQRIKNARVRRLRHIVHALLVTFALVLFINYFSAEPGMWLVLVATMFVLMLAYVPLKHNNPDQAAVILIAVLGISLALVMWQGSGLRSSAMLAYPGLLVFCLMVGNRRLFIVTWLGLVLYMTFLVYATHQGWRTGSEHFSSWLTLAEFIVVVSAIALLIRMLAGDLFTLMDRLERDRIIAQESRREALHRAVHDKLTGLPDRGEARNAFEQALANSQRADRRAALVFMDIDHFKEINDRHGHAVGDQVLLRIAEDIKTRLRKTDTLIRYAGDEFLLVLSHIESRLDVDTLLAELAAQIGRPLALEGGGSLTTGISMGVVIAPDDGESFDELLKHADAAMYSAKRKGRNRYHFYADVQTLPPTGSGV